MKLKKEYSFSNDRQIWRLLPSETGKLIIEERDIEKKQVFFSCIEITSGKSFFSSLQLDEKYWIGIEDIYKDIIYFHGFRQPDMPGHLGIKAFDISSRSIIWENNNYVFSFLLGDKIYAFEQLFEKRQYYVLDTLTGDITDTTDDISEINLLREESLLMKDFEDYRFPEQYYGGTHSEKHFAILQNIKESVPVRGPIEYIVKDNLILFNVYEISDDGNLVNRFRVIDINTGKLILEDELNDKSNAFVPDSFFLKGNLVFLLKNKVQLIVYSISK